MESVLGTTVGVYIAIAFLLQLIFSSFNLRLWLNLFNSTGLGLGSLLLQFLVSALLFFIMVFLLSLAGSLFARSRSS